MDGNSLTTADLVNLGRGLLKIKVRKCSCDSEIEESAGDKPVGVCCSYSLQLAPEAEKKVREGREVIDNFIREDKGMMCPLIFLH